MASVSSTSSLGNTSLRGFGGMVSGIDRDEIIEQLTLGTTTKISNAEKEITQLEWKQEAYRSISDKIIGISDDYFSYTSTSSLIDANVFAKNQITVHGSDKSSKYVTASGTSDLVDSVSIKSVSNLASAAVLQSKAHTNGALHTGLSDLEDTKLEESTLEGRILTLGVYNDGNKTWSNNVQLEFNSQYTKKVDGKDETVRFSYVPPEGATGDDLKEFYVGTTDANGEKTSLGLVDHLNNMFADKAIGDQKFSDLMEFSYDADADKLELRMKDGASFEDGAYKVNTSASSALAGLGYTGDEKAALSVDDFSNALKDGNIASSVKRTDALEGLTGKKVTFTYNGSQKEIELITDTERDKILELRKDGSADARAQLEVMSQGLQERLDRAFGSGKVKVDFDTDGSLLFKTDAGSSVSIISGDDAVLRCMGVEYGASSKLNMSGSLSQNARNLGIADEDLADPDFFAGGIVINGVTIDGITKDSSINSILSKINSSDAGVKATYVEATGQFMLVANETGSGRKITLGNSALTKALFGEESVDGSTGYKSEDGVDATITVSYGNGVDVELKRSSNTFNLEGLTVTVSGVFSETEDRVTFSAKADVDKATERVKSFIEAFNELAEEVNSQLTTRPDSSYGPLTDEQKAEMTETSIENWENKAKQGLLYNDSSIRDLGADIQGIFVKLMNDGSSYEDLEKIGITYSSDYKDGGKLVFDEAKFRAAMESDPEKVSNIFTGGGNVSQGLVKIVESTFTPYATRYASDNAVTSGGRGSYGRLIEEAGSEKAPTTLFNNFIYSQIKDIQDRITTLRSQLVTEQDRYIKQFSTMETLISQMNSQSSWLSQITG